MPRTRVKAKPFGWPAASLDPSARRNSMITVALRMTHRFPLETTRNRAWAAEFVRWYNVDHCHSAIRYVSPAPRHAGQDQAILAARHALYLQARQRNPARWSRNTRDWSYIGVVTLNPERDSVVSMATNPQHTQQKAA